MPCLEDHNYYNDPRVRALSRSDYLEHDEKTMTATWETEDDDTGEPVVITFKTRYEVCGICDGKGRHVNPSIDASGIGSDDEFWDDDEDRETGESRYQRGDYDVDCYNCNGKRVEPVIDTRYAKKQDLERYQDMLECEGECDAISRAERAFGA